MEDIVKEEIRQYQLISKSKSLRNLKPKYASQIAKQVNSQELKQLINKKFSYTQKILKLLNSVLVRDEDDGDDIDLDPQVLTNRFLVEKYIDLMLKNPRNKRKLQDLVLKHQQFESSIAAKRQELEKSGKSDFSEFDNQVLKDSIQLQEESINVLVQLQIPYFVLKKSYHYPELQQDKQWLLTHVTKYFK